MVISRREDKSEVTRHRNNTSHVTWMTVQGCLNLVLFTARLRTESARGRDGSSIAAAMNHESTGSGLRAGEGCRKSSFPLGLSPFLKSRGYNNITIAASLFDLSENTCAARRRWRKAPFTTRPQITRVWQSRGDPLYKNIITCEMRFLMFYHQVQYHFG